ncbi:hypothetical protein E3P99_01521 [Wallemia hederae]|uniref:Uncharacterized protein n=1 Tax=Wallemia hederae TaxID=1540922 RepID=A0A4T0FPF2_9BASI|nr:hypothetical protein E3P99_01521 [Wallemia hederae]
MMISRSVRTSLSTRAFTSTARALANRPEDVESHSHSPWQSTIKEGEEKKEYPGLKPGDGAAQEELGPASADQIGGKRDGHARAGEKHDAPEPGLKDKFKKALGLANDADSKKGRTFATLASRQFSTSAYTAKQANEPKEETNTEQSGHIHHKESPEQPLHAADNVGKPARYNDAIANEEGVHGGARGGYVHGVNSEQAENNSTSSAYPTNDGVGLKNFPAADLDAVKPSGAVPGSSTIPEPLPESIRESVTRTTDPDALGSSNRLRHGQAPGRDFNEEGSNMNDVPRERVESSSPEAARGVNLPPPPRTQAELDTLHPGRKNPPK